MGGDGEVLRLPVGGEIGPTQRAGAKMSVELLAILRGQGALEAIVFVGAFVYSPLCCSNFATSPVQPVWWLAPMPAPLSPWKYS